MGRRARAVGILAYGSLGDDPGGEIGPLVVERIEGIKTPFPVEFARTSRTRGCAPTLVPVFEGGARVKAKILVLEGVSEAEATNALWRRETRREGSGERYEVPSWPNENTVLVRRLEDFEGVDVVLYAEIGANVPDLTPRNLAELAIGSARPEAGSLGRDGITYLIRAKANGAETPLMPEYEREILRLTKMETLEQAREVLAR